MRNLWRWNFPKVLSNSSTHTALFCCRDRNGFDPTLDIERRTTAQHGAHEQKSLPDMDLRRRYVARLSADSCRAVLALHALASITPGWDFATRLTNARPQTAATDDRNGLAKLPAMSLC